MRPLSRLCQAPWLSGAWLLNASLAHAADPVATASSDPSQLNEMWVRDPGEWLHRHGGLRRTNGDLLRARILSRGRT